MNVKSNAGAPAAVGGSAGSIARAPTASTTAQAGAPSTPSGVAGASANADPFATPASSGGTPTANAMCKDIVCFDVFDCWLGILGGDGLNCNFQSCDGFVCK
jgi:hypothetical protein